VSAVRLSVALTPQMLELLGQVVVGACLRGSTDRTERALWERMNEAVRAAERKIWTCCVCGKHGSGRGIASPRVPGRVEHLRCAR